MSRVLPAIHLLLAAACVILGSCAGAPAGLRHLAHDEPELHALLQQALEAKDEARRKEALGHFVERWKREGMGTSHTLTPGGRTGMTYAVKFEDHLCADEALDYYDEIHPASHFKIRKLKHHMRPGIGTPLMALRENRKQTKLDEYFPPEAITRAITVVANPGPVEGATQEVRISLLCPLRNDEVVVDGKSVPLAADFSVPWASVLSRSGTLNRTKFLEMITRSPRRQPRLYLMEPYDPRKEPLIMIHGLASTPLAWANLSNEIWADDAIRRRYQIWHYLYNTSAPPLYSSHLLREQLKEVRALLDPEGDDPAMRRTTLLTHSMGGLVGKTLAMEPRDKLWKAAFHVPPQQIILPKDDKETLHEHFEWKADPTIHRIIFVATPHRGSEVADSLLGRIGTLLTKPSWEYYCLYKRLAEDNPGVFTPDYQFLGRGKLNSVSFLSTKQPTLRILAEMPFAHPVTVHCVMGDRGRCGPIQESSDGVVRYSSSHLDCALSECVVHDGHGCYRHPKAVEEIKRVLKL